ncbi:MAG: DUF3817 domain-containing protein [Cyclobacteriaceae bacterium]
MNPGTPIGRLRITAVAEGISYLLFAITMPLKYGLDITEPNFIVGAIHGFLFIVYIGLCLQNIWIHNWNLKLSFLILLASLIPFATFYADAKVFNKI